MHKNESNKIMFDEPCHISITFPRFILLIRTYKTKHHIFLIEDPMSKQVLALSRVRFSFLFFLGISTRLDVDYRDNQKDYWDGGRFTRSYV